MFFQRHASLNSLVEVSAEWEVTEFCLRRGKTVEVEHKTYRIDSLSRSANSANSKGEEEEFLLLQISFGFWGEIGECCCFKKEREKSVSDGHENPLGPPGEPASRASTCLCIYAWWTGYTDYQAPLVHSPLLR